MNRALRKMRDDFKLGVLGATHRGRAFAAWLTLAFYAFAVVFCFVIAGWYGLIVAVIQVFYTYMTLDVMAGLERAYRNR